MEQDQEGPHLKSKKEVARYLNIKPSTVARLMQNGLKYVKVGSLIRFRAEDVAEYLAQRVIDLQKGKKREINSEAREL